MKVELLLLAGQNLRLDAPPGDEGVWIAGFQIFGQILQLALYCSASKNFLGSFPREVSNFPACSDHLRLCASRYARLKAASSRLIVALAARCSCRQLM